MMLRGLSLKINHRVLLVSALAFIVTLLMFGCSGVSEQSSQGSSGEGRPSATQFIFPPTYTLTPAGPPTEKGKPPLARMWRRQTPT